MKLTKIKLINWHIFSDNVINVEGNLLITGENGNGKSTLIDAIFFVLSGGDEKNFNSAANEESKRNLTTYMRGKLGIENKEFLRDDTDIISHIALEFYDEATFSSHILGCVLSIENSSKPRSKFYIALNSKIDSLTFISDECGMNFNEFKEFNAKYDITDLKDTYTAKRTKIAQFLNITDSKKYYELLTKAIAFKPINTDVSDFVFNFLLKEDDVNIESLAKELSEYKEIQRTIEREKDKLACLGTFIDKAKQFVEYQKDIKYLTILKKSADIGSIEKEIEKINNKLLEQSQCIEDSNIDIEFIKEKLKQIVSEIESFEKNGEFLGIKEKNAYCNALKEQKAKLEETIEEVENGLSFEMEIMKSVELKYDFLKDIQSGNIALLNKHIKEYIAELNEVKENLRRDITIKNREIETSNKRIYNLGQELHFISQGKNNYDPKVRDLMTLIKSQLGEKYGRDIAILPLCECIEIVDKEWTDAIEGFLNTQRFDLILAPEYFYDASQVYEKYAKDRNLYDIGIVNTNVEGEVKVLDNSLFTKIKVLNPHAKVKCQKILGRVLCVDSVYEFKPHQTCITKSCMKYTNDTTSAINPRIYAVPFIGEESIIKRKAILEKELAEERLNNGQVNNELKELERKIRTLNYSKLNCNEVDNYWAKLNKLNESIEDLTTEINDISKNEDMIHLMDEFNGLKKQQMDLSSEILEIGKKQAEINATIQSLRNKKYHFEENLKEEKASFEIAYSELDDIEEFKLFKEKFFSLGINPSYEIEKRIRINNNIKDSIQLGMREYVKEYNANLLAEIACINDFISEYNRINETGIVLNEATAAEVFKNAQIAFNENFISKIRDKIKYIRRELDRINDNLKRHPFGSNMETYEFVPQPSGNQELREYARIIMSGKEIGQKDLFTETLDSRDCEIMQGLFDKLAAIGDPTQSEKDLHKYLDYRQYYKYDIVIKDKNQDKTYFSKTHKEKSGGEMQTPFYVIIGACFDELIRRDERISSACIVAFDEAFNNMDESRIITLMNYYKKLNIQLIIVVPTNHSQGLIPCVDTVVSLIKRNNNIYETYLING